MLFKWGRPLTPLRVFLSCEIPISIIWKYMIKKPYIFFAHPIGICIARQTKFEGKCKIFSCVTIGRKENSPNAPTIKDNVTIYTGAKVLGNITVGENSRIGANAVVVKDVPPNTVVAGVPAKEMIKK